MLSSFIKKALTKAEYKILKDGSYFGKIPNFNGVWANDKKLEKCRKELEEVLEEWLVLKIYNKEKIPLHQIMEVI